MRNTIAVAVRVSLVTIVLTGILYPFAVTGAARLLFPWQAAGSLVRDAQGTVVGSALIAQPFSRAGYFQPRPSAAGDHGWDAAASGGSNLGPTSKKLRDRVQGELERLGRANPEAPGPAPEELVTASASGLDPHLSPEAARWQIPRVARARGVAADRVRALVDAAVEGRDVGLLGEPRVNVLRLNLALDRELGQLVPQPPAPAAAP